MACRRWRDGLRWLWRGCGSGPVFCARKRREAGFGDVRALPRMRPEGFERMPSVIPQAQSPGIRTLRGFPPERAQSTPFSPKPSAARRSTPGRGVDGGRAADAGIGVRADGAKPVEGLGAVRRQEPLERPDGLKGGKALEKGSRRAWDGLRVGGSARRRLAGRSGFRARCPQSSQGSDCG